MKSMAAIQTEFGKNVQVEEIDIPDPTDEQVIVKLKSTGVWRCRGLQAANAAPYPGAAWEWVCY